jgi:hypothetical protein
MVGLAALEVVGFGLSTLTEALGFDFGVDVHLADHAHVDHAGEVDADFDVLGWLGVGKVPVGVLLVSFLFLFGTTGVLVQHLAEALLAHPLGAALAGLITAPPSLALNGLTARGLAKVLPHDTTTAVTLDTLLGRRAKMQDMAAKPGLPARAEVRDEFGQTHYVMVLPQETCGELLPDEEVLLFRREGVQFWAVQPEGFLNSVYGSEGR